MEVAHAITGGLALAFLILTILAAIVAWLSFKHDVAILGLWGLGSILSFGIGFLVTGLVWLTTFPH